MFKNKKLILLATLILVSLSTEAQNKNIRTYGLGMSSCGALVQAFRQDSPDAAINFQGKSHPTTAHAYQQWLAAFITSYNMYGSGNGNLGNVPDIHGYIEWVHSYCMKNPTVTVLEASTAMINVLEKK